MTKQFSGQGQPSKKIECREVAVVRVDLTENLRMKFVERAKTVVDWATMDEDKKKK